MGTPQPVKSSVLDTALSRRKLLAALSALAGAGLIPGHAAEAGAQITLPEFNDLFAAVTGYGPSDPLLGKSFLEAFASEDRVGNSKWAYKNQFWIENYERRAYSAFGVFGQMIHIDPDADFVAVKLSSWPDFVDAALEALTMAAVNAVKHALGGDGAERR